MGQGKRRTLISFSRSGMGYFRFPACSVEPRSCACQAMKGVGKSYAGKLYVLLDEGRWKPLSAVVRGSRVR